MRFFYSFLFLCFFFICALDTVAVDNCTSSKFRWKIFGFCIFFSSSFFIESFSLFSLCGTSIWLHHQNSKVMQKRMTWFVHRTTNSSNNNNNNTNRKTTSHDRTTEMLSRSLLFVIVCGLWLWSILCVPIYHMLAEQCYFALLLDIYKIGQVQYSFQRDSAVMRLSLGSDQSLVPRINSIEHHSAHILMRPTNMSAKMLSTSHLWASHL